MLVTLDDTKNYLAVPLGDTTYDVFLNSQIAFLSSVIESYCRRKFEQATYTQEFFLDQFDDISQRRQLWAFSFPIISVTTVKEVITVDGVDDETLVDATQYRIHKPFGKLEKFNEYGLKENWFACMSQGYMARVEVVYDAGYAIVPLEIQNVMFELIAERFNKHKSGIDLNFGNDVQRFSVPGVMSIDFDYTLQNNERNTRFGMFIKGYSNVLDMFRSERAVLGTIKDNYVS